MIRARTNGTVAPVHCLYCRRIRERAAAMSGESSRNQPRFPTETLGGRGAGSPVAARPNGRRAYARQRSASRRSVAPGIRMPKDPLASWNNSTAGAERRRKASTGASRTTARPSAARSERNSTRPRRPHAAPQVITGSATSSRYRRLGVQRTKLPARHAPIGVQKEATAAGTRPISAAAARFARRKQDGWTRWENRSWRARARSHWATASTPMTAAERAKKRVKPVTPFSPPGNQTALPSPKSTRRVNQ